MAVEPLSVEDAARVFTEELDSIEKDDMDKLLFVLTFGNAHGNGLSRILNYIQTLSLKNYNKYKVVYAQILSIDPEFKSRTPFDSNYPVRQSFDTFDSILLSVNSKEYVGLPPPDYRNPSKPDPIDTSKVSEYVGVFEKSIEIDAKGRIIQNITKYDKSIYLEGLICFIADEIPSQYNERDIEFTEQIHKDRSFAYADQCIPAADHPFQHILPHIQRVLELGGTVVIDNDAWHELNIPEKGIQYLSNLYMQYYCEVLYYLRQMHNPNILFLHTSPKSSNEFDLKPLDANFLPKGMMRFYPPVRFNNSTGGSRRTRRARRQRSRTHKRGLNKRR
jgi:hypothetical protein